MMTHAGDRHRVELIFRSLDTAGRGALEKVELEALAAKLNPDMSFSPFQLAVIADEICHCYAKFYREGHGLSLEGLQQLYADNPKSLDRDFALLSPLEATAAAAAAASAQPSSCVSSIPPSESASKELDPPASGMKMHSAEALAGLMIGEPAAKLITGAGPNRQRVSKDLGSPPLCTTAQGSPTELDGMLSANKVCIQQTSTSTADNDNVPTSDTKQPADLIASPESSLPVKRLDFSGASGPDVSPVNGDRAADIILRALMGTHVPAATAVGNPSVSVDSVTRLSIFAEESASSPSVATPSAPPSIGQSTGIGTTMTKSPTEWGGTNKQADTWSPPSVQASCGTHTDIPAGCQPEAAAAVAMHPIMLQTPSASSAVEIQSKPQTLLGTPELQAADMLTAYADSTSSSDGVSGSSVMAAEALEISRNQAPSPLSPSTWRSRHGNSPLPELEADSTFTSFSFPSTAIGTDRSSFPVQPLSTLDVATSSSAATGESTQGGLSPASIFSFSSVMQRPSTVEIVSPIWAPLCPGSEQQPALPEALAHTTLPAAAVLTPPEVSVQTVAQLVDEVSAQTSPEEVLRKSLRDHLVELGNPPRVEGVRQLFCQAEGLPDDEAAAAHLQMAAHLIETDMPLLAVDSLKAALTKPCRSSDQRVLFRLAGILFGLQQYSAARQAYSSALLVAPSDAVECLRPKILLNLGITLELEDCLPQACDSYRAALAFNPGHSRLHKLLGSALFALGDLSAAEAALQQSLALEPDYADALCDLGATLLAAGRPEEACRMFDRALELDSGHIEALYNMGNLCRQSADFAGALKCYDAVLVVDPQHWKSLLNKSVALIGLERHAEAQVALQRTYKLAGRGSALQDEIKRLKQIAACTRP